MRVGHRKAKATEFSLPFTCPPLSPLRLGTKASRVLSPALVTFCSHTSLCGVSWNLGCGAPRALVLGRDVCSPSESPAGNGAVLVPPSLPSFLWGQVGFAATSGPMTGDAVALPCPLKFQSRSCSGQWADGSFRPQAPGERHWEADREGAKGEMNTEPRNRCVPADLVWLVPFDHQRQCRPLPWPSGNRVSALPGNPFYLNLLSNKTLQSVCFSRLFYLPTPEPQFGAQNAAVLSQGVSLAVGVAPEGAE